MLFDSAESMVHVNPHGSERFESFSNFLYRSFLIVALSWFRNQESGGQVTTRAPFKRFFTPARILLNGLVKIDYILIHALIAHLVEQFTCNE